MQGQFSVPLDEPTVAAVAADEHISPCIRRDSIRSAVRAAVLEIVHGCPRAGAANTLSDNPVIGIPSRQASDEQIAVRVGHETAGLSGGVRGELVIVHGRPGVAAVGALAHDPVVSRGGDGSAPHHVEVAGSIRANAHGDRGFRQ